MTKEIELTQGKVALVDDGDYEWLLAWKWHAHWSVDRWYARTGTGGKKQYMHRLIIGATASKDVDHKDNNGLNNCRDNIKVATHKQNIRRQKMASSNSSGYKGVCHSKNKYRVWRAYIVVDGKHICLGGHFTKEDAAMAYDIAAIKYYGEYAMLNFPR